MPLERQRVLVRNSRRFKNWGFCDLLLESAYELRFDDPQKALDLVGLGVDVAFGLDGGSRLNAGYSRDPKDPKYKYLNLKNPKNPKDWGRELDL